MVANNVGNWALECKVNDHFMAGMKALYEVKLCGLKEPKFTANGITRKYFIGIVEAEWNYADSKWNMITGDVLDDTDR